MHGRSNSRYSPEATALERRDLMTGVVKLPFSTFPDPLLNNKGAVIGVPVTVETGGSESAFVLQPRPDAKPKPILALPGDTTTQANALNDAGQVIGLSSSRGSSGPSTERAFLYSPKSGTALIPALPGYDTVNPTLLSKGGLVAGSDLQSSLGYAAFSESRGFLYSKHRGTVDLGTLPGFPNLLPTAINDQAGLVVGAASSAYDPTSSKPPIVHAFSFNVAHRKLTDLGTPPGFDEFSPVGVDARGVIVGTAVSTNADFTVTTERVFLHRPGAGWKDIGLLHGFDRIALVDQMDDGSLLIEVGNSQTKATHAAIYQDGKGLLDIAALPATSTDVAGNDHAATLSPANKHGLALVTNTDSEGVDRLYVLNLKTHALTDITSQISDPQSIRSSNSIPVSINDRDQFLVPISTPGQGTDTGFGDPQTEYLVSLDAKGTPVPSSVTRVGV